VPGGGTATGVARKVLPGAAGEQTYGASAAVRAGRRVFLSGLTAQAVGGGAAAQFRRAADRAGAALEALGSSLGDVVRTRIFCTRPQDLAVLGAAHGERFGAVRPALSLTQASFLPGVLPGVPGVLLEVEAVQGAAEARAMWAFDLPHAVEWGYSGVVRVGDALWVSGVTALLPDGSVAAPGDLAGQARVITSRIVAMLEACGARAADVVATRHYTAVPYAGHDTTAERLALMHPHHPTSAGITVQGVGPRRAGLLIEVEAIAGAAERRVNRNTGRPYEEVHHYSRSVRVGDVVYVSGTTSVQLDESVGSPFDAAGQTRQTLDWIRWGIERQGLALDDLVQTRSYVVGEENLEPVAQVLREVLGSIKPAATVIGVPTLGRPSILVEIEATAVADANLAASEAQRSEERRDHHQRRVVQIGQELERGAEG
jgi:enamine deaminase RidA (YjgF/YER057c/UK114 family)